MKKNRIALIIGILLLLYAIYHIISLQIFHGENPPTNENLINQAGYAPLIAREEEIHVLSEKSSTTDQNIPDRIIIPEINLDAPVEVAQAVTTEIDNKEYVQYLVPEKFAAGYHENSAPLGTIGNTVISGHHNAYGEVFAQLYLLKPGDIIDLYSKGKLFEYVVSNVMILEEKDQLLEVRLENARWILPSDDERLTLVTCWPHESNTHRLIVVALPTEVIQPTENQTVCNNKNETNQYFNAYIKAEYFSQYTSENDTNFRQIIINLYELQKKVLSLDEHNCFPVLKKNLADFIKAKILQTAFDQIGYQGEEYEKLKNLLQSYKSILESYFVTYKDFDRETLIESFQSESDRKSVV